MRLATCFMAALLVAGTAVIFAAQDRQDPACPREEKPCCEKKQDGSEAKQGCEGRCHKQGVEAKQGCEGKGTCGEAKQGCEGRSCDGCKKACGEVKQGCEGKNGCGGKQGCEEKSCRGQDGCGEAQQGCEGKKGCGEAKDGCGGGEAKNWEKGDGLGKFNWVSSHDRTLQEAREQNKPALVHFFAGWCGPCRTMNRTTFADSKVAGFQNANFVSTQVDIDEAGDLAAKYRIEMVPTIVVVMPSGETLARMSELEPTPYLKQLQSAAQGFAQCVSLKEQIARNPEEASFHFQLGALFDSLGAPREAAVPYERAFDLYAKSKESSDSYRKQLGDLLVRVGDGHIDGRNDIEAKNLDRIAEKLEGLDPDGKLGFADNALYLRAVAQGVRKDADRMLDLLTQLSVKYPDSDKIEAGVIWTAWASLNLLKNKAAAEETLRAFGKKYPQSAYRSYADQLLRMAKRSKID